MTKQFIGEDGYMRVNIAGEVYILANIFHYRHIAQREAKDYLVPAKVKVIDGGGNKGSYGIWMQESEWLKETR